MDATIANGWINAVGINAIRLNSITIWNEPGWITNGGTITIRRCPISTTTTWGCWRTSSWCGAKIRVNDIRQIHYRLEKIDSDK